MQVVLNQYELKQIILDHLQNRLSTEQDFLVVLGVNTYTGEIEAVATPRG
jgi:hypothetical protein